MTLLWIFVGAWTFAQQTVPVPDSPTSWITSGGIVGFLCFTIVAFLRGWIVPGWIHQRLMDDKVQEINELKQDRSEMTLFLREQVMPALTRANDFASSLAEQRQKEQYLKGEK
jgi:hypothetical protein